VNKKLQRLGIFLVICYLAIFAKLHVTQLVDQQSLAAQPDNLRETQRKLNKPRGKIISADGAILAQSINVGGNMTPRVRQYPEGELFAHVTGIYSGLYGTQLGVEKTYDRQLTGDTTAQQFDGLTNLFSTRENVGNVSVTVRKDLQELARDELGDRIGAVTVLDPRDGRILAMYSTPTYDPNLLMLSPQRSLDDVKAAYALYQQNPGKPMLSKNYRDTYFPGSSFKPVTAAVGIGTGKVTPTTPVYESMEGYQPPDARQTFIRNFAGKACGGNLLQITASSCNTAFMVMGVQNGWPAMAAGATAFGYNKDVPIDLPGAVKSDFPDTPEEFRSEAIAGLAQNSIGQKSNNATPLQIAMVSAAAANDGKIMVPHVLDKVRNQDATVVEEWKPQVFSEAMTPDVAAVVKQAMWGPVNDPTGSAYGRIKVPAGITAFGKTGTAQVGAGNNLSLNTWFTGFAGPTGGTPTVAVSVVVLGQRVGDEITGGQVSAPIANRMLNAALGVVDQPVDPSDVIITPTTSVPPAGPFAPNPGDSTTPTTPTTRRQG
jgi:peptidoglycan glycosyltransferase